MPRRFIAPGSGLILPAALLMLGAYFAFAALQGEYGILRRIDLRAEQTLLRAELDSLTRRAEALRSANRRLSDDFLDLDLLDERARVVLGLARIDEIIVEPITSR